MLSETASVTASERFSIVSFIIIPFLIIALPSLTGLAIILPECNILFLNKINNIINEKGTL